MADTYCLNPEIETVKVNRGACIRRIHGTLNTVKEISKLWQRNLHPKYRRGHLPISLASTHSYKFMCKGHQDFVKEVQGYGIT